jgi:hypothetical protein
MTTPIIPLHWPALVTALIVSFLFGYLWYTPLFGKTWCKLMGISTSKKPNPKDMRKAMLLQLLGLFLICYVMAYSSQVWRPSVWGLGEDQSNWCYGFWAGFFTWLGFFVPQQLGKVAWEMRSWKLFLINTGHDFINLQIIAQILAHWRA